MTDNIDKKENNNKHVTETPVIQPHGTPTLAWISLMLALLAWASLFWFNGYVALVLAIASAACGFAGIPRRTASVRRFAITAIIAAMVLTVVVASYLIVIKIGLT